MRNIMIAWLVTSVAWSATAAAIPAAEILQLPAAPLSRAAGTCEDTVNEILRQHAALLKAFKERASRDALIAVGRSLVAPQRCAMPGSQRFLVDFDPSTVLRQVVCPVLALLGGRWMTWPSWIAKR